ncbi:MAG: metallophosphoesterase [Phycisphaerae bacterium]|nr:metallophosphoesterase [Phycisphaerae bacterium]
MCSTPAQLIRAILPRDGRGHQFVCYADACSGVAGTPHEATFAAVNAVLSRLQPPPELICFPGDEILGLTADDDALRAQWRYWFDAEMAWLDRTAIPIYHTTGNHTAYDPASEAVFREVMAHLPQNGPPDQKGLTYHVRRDDLLLVFVNTLWSGFGGEGRVEHGWLDRTLAEHADARHKFVFGHHPVFPVNGLSGVYQRDIAPEYGRQFWNTLVKHEVFAYVCSHILAFDVQVHDGVLQILTAGAGTADRMPEKVEYLHCVQAAVDACGLRYQVLDTSARIREWLEWPLQIPPSKSWTRLQYGEQPAVQFSEDCDPTTTRRLLVWRFTGVSSEPIGVPQTLLSAWDNGPLLAPLWIGLLGPEHRLVVSLSSAPGCSPHLWHGPTLKSGQTFDIQIAVHTGMGPGGILWRSDDNAPWSSMSAASPWGAERLAWPARWGIGHGQRGPHDRPFHGRDLQASFHSQTMNLILDGGEPS